ncbi:MAG: PTS sugar transporter subunit IIA [Spirochaetaceae bacterium]|jgi:PTS system nitrogen regulatory IIA component|nr:PTS sugar transporter subunit IIA [Spirochaetaceae bacterium]
MHELKNEILTLEEVASYLRLSERTVYEWAQHGEIPAGKLGAVWRFKKSEIEKWVNEKLSLANTEDGLIDVQKILSTDRIVFFGETTKKEALLTLVENLSSSPCVKNKKELKEALLKREELMSCTIGSGIAIPHIRLSSVSNLTLSIGVSEQGIQDYHALDEEPVRLIFMIAAAYNQHAYYLQTLSFFSQALKKDDLRSSLITSKTSQEVYDKLNAAISKIKTAL